MTHYKYYYGKDERASRKTILLESGDALVFGGPARSVSLINNIKYFTFINY